MLNIKNAILELKFWKFIAISSKLKLKLKGISFKLKLALKMQLKLKLKLKVTAISSSSSSCKTSFCSSLMISNNNCRHLFYYNLVS
jgi:hypothetical protein